ncbi:MAG: WD40 repeat domain-containing protein [Bacteroidota bacterium]
MRWAAVRALSRVAYGLALVLTVSGWAASALHAQHAPRLYLQVGHTAPVTDVAISPDGRYLATASEDATARLWEAETGHEVRRFVGHEGELNAIAFSPDGRVLATAGDDASVRMWEVASGQEVRLLEGHTGAVTAVAFGAEGRLIATTSWDGSVRVWTSTTGQQVHHIEAHTSAALSVTFSPDGRYLAAHGLHGNVALIDAASGEILTTRENEGAPVTALAFSPESDALALGDAKGSVELYRFTQGGLRKGLREDVGERQTAHNRKVVDLSFSPDGHYLATSSQDGTVRLWERSSKREVGCFDAYASGGCAWEGTGESPYNGEAGAVAFSPDGRFVASGGSENTARTWEISSGRQEAIFGGYIQPVYRTRFASNGHHLVFRTRGATQRMSISDISSSRVDTLGDRSSSIAYSPDGRYRVVAADQGLSADGYREASVEWLDTLTGRSVRRTLPSKWAPGIAISPNGTRIALTTTGPPDPSPTVYEWRVQLWDVDANAEPYVVPSFYTVAKAFSHDGAYLSTEAFGRVMLWDVERRRAVRLEGGSSVEVVRGDTTFTAWKVEGGAATFSRDGRQLFAVVDDNVRVWDVTSE